MPRAPIVLVHGAWQGGWAWRNVRRLLIDAAIEVFTPTLSTLGERSVADQQPVGLSQHVADIVNVIEFEDLDDVVLVGHSYGGMVITGVADRLPHRIRRLVYIDAAVPADGDDFAAAIPALSPAQAEQRRDDFRRRSPDGVWLPPKPSILLGVGDPVLANWIEQRSRPHPLASWLEPLHFFGRGHDGIPKTYVLATDPANTAMGYPVHAALARRGGEWSCIDIACGHQIPALRPIETARILLDLL